MFLSFAGNPWRQVFLALFSVIFPLSLFAGLGNCSPEILCINVLPGNQISAIRVQTFASNGILNEIAASSGIFTKSQQIESRTSCWSAGFLSTKLYFITYSKTKSFPLATVWCFDTETMQTLWQSHFLEKQASADKLWLFRDFDSIVFSRKNMITRLDSDTGTKLWTKTLSRGFFFKQLLSLNSNISTNGRIIFFSSISENKNDTFLHCYNINSGSTYWINPLKHFVKQASATSISGILFSNNESIFRFNQGRKSGFSGLLWKISAVNSIVLSSKSLETFYCVSDDQLSCFDASTGRRHWKTVFNCKLRLKCAYLKDDTIVIFGDSQAKQTILLVYKQPNGEQISSKEIDADKVELIKIVDKFVIYRNSSGVACINRYNGKLYWRHSLASLSSCSSQNQKSFSAKN